MSDVVPRLAPRSAAAIADTELLRVARTGAGEAGARTTVTLAGRIRGLLLRAVRPEA